MKPDSVVSRWLSLRLIAAHFQAYRQMPKGRFLWRITLEGMVMPVILMVLVKLVVSFPPNAHDLSLVNPIKLFVWIVVAAPVYETIIFKWLPVMLARRWGVGFWGQVATSLVLFAPPHFANGIEAGISGGVSAGFYLVFTYVRWRQSSLKEAFYMTIIAHALHNLLVYIFVIYLPAILANHG